MTGPSSDTTGTIKKSNENCCASGSSQWQRISSEVMVRGLKNCCMCEEMDRMEDEEEAVNVRQKMGTVKAHDRNGEAE
jgi:hypothetical protein